MCKSCQFSGIRIWGGVETVNLTDVDNLRENIYHFLRIPYSKTCNYCDIASADEELIEPAVQLERKNNMDRE